MKQIMLLLCLLVSILAGCTTENIPSSTNEKTENYKLSAFSMPVQTEYIYDYLGIRFQLGEEVNKALEEGKLFMYLDAGYEQDSQELAYARQAILYVPKEDREKIWENDKQKVQDWKEQAQRLGYIGAYKRSVLEQTDITTLTNCTENKNIGETPDDTWQYYISSNNIPEVQPAAERFRRTLVTIYEMQPFTEGVSIFAEAREKEQEIGDFQLTDIYGNPINKEIFANHDLTLVNIFITQASPCLQEIAELEKVSQHDFGEKSVQVVGIVYDAAQMDSKIIEAAKTIHQELAVSYPFVVPDNTLMEGRLKGVAAFPETFFVDKEGKIVGEYYLGARPQEDWIEVIQKELQNLP